MRILFVGKTWNGSSPRSLREALAQLPGVEIDDVGEDHYLPKGSATLLRIANRVLRPLQRHELARDLSSKLAILRPQVLMVYKGGDVSAALIREAKRAGVLAVNVFPDCSPHAHGAALKAAMGEYDLVVSTKPFHPAGWQTIYGYRNTCVFVPHGYDPSVHWWPEPPAEQDFDLLLAATWRPEYHALMLRVAVGLPSSLRIGIMGAGWKDHAQDLPSQWHLVTPTIGRAYGKWLRRGRIVIAPLSREVFSGGVQQPGDEDSTRTYELAAMGCFFLHCRTPYAQTVYDETSEVPMWSDADELVSLVKRYLPMERARREMAARAHARAVPQYSIPNRARQIVDIVGAALEGGKSARR